MWFKICLHVPSHYPFPSKLPNVFCKILSVKVSVSIDAMLDVTWVYTKTVCVAKPLVSFKKNTSIAVFTRQH